MRIVPSIDILDGKCVSLNKGDYSSAKIFNQDPLELAKKFEDSGIKYLRLVDLDGAQSKQVVNHKILNAIATTTKLKVDFSGGLRTAHDLKIIFESGAYTLTCGSLALNNPVLFLKSLKKYGPDKIILSADCKSDKLVTEARTSESDYDILEFIADYKQIGVESVVCTDVSKDPMLLGPAVELYKKILSASKIKLIASGGISSVSDLKTLKKIGCEAAIVGKVIYEKRITLKELEKLI